jgi:hypothetical protein
MATRSAASGMLTEQAIVTLSDWLSPPPPPWFVKADVVVAVEVGFVVGDVGEEEGETLFKVATVRASRDVCEGKRSGKYARGLGAMLLVRLARL